MLANPLKKLIGLVIAITIMAWFFPTAVSASNGFGLGEFTVISENNQQNGWCTNGVDGIETNLYIRALQRVTNFFFDFDCEVDNITFVCLGDGNDWTWSEIPVYVEAKRGHINIEDIDGWADIIAGNDVKILLCNYDPSWENITVKGFTSIPSGPFENQRPWAPKNFKIGPGKTLIPAVDFDPDDYEEHGAKNGIYAIRPEMAAANGPQTEFGWSGFGDNICQIDAGEWVQYTAEVTREGRYSFSAWIAPAPAWEEEVILSGGNIEIYVDGVFVGTSVDIDVDSTDGYYDLFPVGSVDLAEGTHIIKTLFPKGNIKFSALEIVSLYAPESDPEEAPNVIASAPDTSDMGTDIFMLFALLSVSFSFVFGIAKAAKPQKRH